MLIRQAYTMFNVWLPAVLESRATGEGDEAIKEALREFVLYSCGLLEQWRQPKLNLISGWLSWIYSRCRCIIVDFILIFADWGLDDPNKSGTA